MGRLIDGKWQAEDVNPETKDGEFHRESSRFCEKVGSERFPAQSDRYHLYVSYACPWAHRTLIARKLKGLEKLISVSVVSPYMGDGGWGFHQDFEGVTEDEINGTDYLRDVYRIADARYTGKVTVPILWDKKLKTIVTNESSVILRNFNDAFNELTGNDLDLYPEEHRGEIEVLNQRIYEHINDGVYKTGFARSQEAYERNYKELFAELDRLERLLEGRTYLVGERLTEVDIRLFVTLIRFDAVYYSHFKCNRHRIVDYAHLQRWLEKIYRMPHVKETVRFDHIKHHYYWSHPKINPSRIVPLGPRLEIEDL